MINMRVKGMKELEAALKQLPNKIQVNIARGAIRKGAQVVQQEMIARAPVGRGSYGGALRDSIRVGTTALGGKVGGYVRAGGKRKGRKNVYYAHFIEWGTKAHRIRSDKGMPIGRGGRVVHEVFHPGIQPKPFARPALDLRYRDAIAATAARVAQLLRRKHGLDIPDPEISLDEIE